MIPNIYLSDEQVREIRKKQAILDPAWSADGENNMIRAGADKGADNAVKKVAEWLNPELMKAAQELYCNADGWMVFITLEEWEALKKLLDTPGKRV